MDKNHSNRTLLGANGVVKGRSGSFASNEDAGLFCFTGDMKRYKKKDYLTTIELLEEINRNLQESGWKQPDLAAVLADCQEAAITLGTNLEQQGEIGIQLTHILEEYCENLYQLGEQLDGGKQEKCALIAGKIDRQLAVLKEKLEEQFEDKKEIVFLPYKASMWDSLESIWLAAEADPACHAYVIPIPYYERNADGNFGTFHYEGGEFPEEVPLTSYEDYSIEERRPDVIYIHNPYDQYNNATSVDPRFYSAELKKYTDALVYVPYYATAGGMAEGQKLCSAYMNADYIVIQSEKYRKFFDERIPDQKFLPLGSPKFDSVIRMCSNPPEPPEAWKSKLEGKTVYFYNTSLGGMLADTAGFLQKMAYVFQRFEGREDSCLLWRPHPLLETTFDSMRKEYRPQFDRLKQEFIEKGIGIYDDTPDIEKTIALSDVYIGDAGTSVTSLFGIAGKPLFIFNNFIHSLPKEDDWRGGLIQGFFLNGQDDWVITPENQLYHSPNHDYVYEFYCDLSVYAGGNYYQQAIEMDGKIYVCPANAQDILILEDHHVVKRVKLKHELERDGAFCYTWKIGSYLYLIPNQYPAIVRYDVKNDRVDYLNGYREIFVKNVNGEWHIGGSCIWKNQLVLASPDDDRILMIDGDSMQVKELRIPAEEAKGCMVLVPEGEELWLLPFEGGAVIRWNPDRDTARVYQKLPEGFACKNRPHGYACMERPFSRIAFTKDKAVLSPYWGNMFLEIDKESGEIRAWNPPFPVEENGKNGYWYSWAVATFLQQVETAEGENVYRLFYYPERKLYEINLDTGDCREISIVFDKEEVRSHEAGYCENSEWLQYCCVENAFCSLKDLLDGTISGALFDRHRQLAAYAKITANVDGTCGEKIHQTICGKDKS